MEKTTILWADDEIDLLKPHILFLTAKGYDIITALSGDEAIDIVKENNNLSAVLLDENMPGISGLEALTKIKQLKSDLPVIMITKSEEEYVMEDAIGSKISDYLIKPVNPNFSRNCPVKIGLDRVAGYCASQHSISKWALITASTPDAIALVKGASSISARRLGE